MQPVNRHSLRGGFHAYCALSSGIGFLAPVVHAMRMHRRELGISTGMPGPHAFTSATASFVRAPKCAASPRGHRIPASRVVTIARNAPLDEAGWQQEIMLFGKTKVIYFSRRDWTGQIKLIALAKFVGARDQALRPNRRAASPIRACHSFACTFTHN